MFLALAHEIPKNIAWPLPQCDHQVNIVNANEYYLVSNICPHQNSKITQCATDKLKCPYHGMSFDINGNGINNGFSLPTSKTYQSQSMLFDSPVNYTFPIDLQHMKLIEQRVDIVDAPAEIIMDVFLDIDHIPVAHEGVYDQIGIEQISKISWETFDNGSLQFVVPDRVDHIIPQDLQYNLGAVWMAVYPDTMIEWQPGALFVTVVKQKQTHSCVYVYKYRDLRYSDQSWALNDQVWELAWSQDRKLAQGIESLALSNIDVLKQHYRTYIKNAL